MTKEDCPVGFLADWFSAGWVETMGTERCFCAMFSFAITGNKVCEVLIIRRGQTKSPFFILTIHTFAEVELDETDFLLKSSWQMTNTLLKSSDEDYFHRTHCFPAGSNSY